MNAALTAPSLSRLELVALSRQNAGRHIRIAVHRNHSFEMVASVLNAFLLESGLCAEFVYSSYDDSLNFSAQDDGLADVHLLWIDVGRYNTPDPLPFLMDRVAALRAMTSRPILVALLKGRPLSALPSGVFEFPLDEIVGPLGSAAFDLAKEPYSGTRMSSRASLECARQMGLCYLPAALLPPLKAIVVDLDNTLYRGILGEDGIDGLVPNLKLQEQLLAFKGAGGLLAIASKNDAADVRKMFDRRSDFVLRWSDFAASSIGWHDKATGVTAIAQQLNILPDAMLFIDDNPAELQNVERTGVRMLLADADVVRNLTLTPGLLRFRGSQEDTLRTKDIQANVARKALSNSCVSPEEYFRKLQIRLVFSVNVLSQAPRVAELLGKTNQFILGYSRMSEVQVLERMRNSDSCIVTVRMSDILSDSGIIAIAVARKDGAVLQVDDLTVSCRALGRNLENVMLPYMLQIAAKKLGGASAARISYRRGPRNVPGMKWLEEFACTPMADEGIAAVDLSEEVSLAGLSVEVLL